jgi:hypothetical protein
MLLFRGEGHIDVWCQQWKQSRGATLTLSQVKGLADCWYTPDRRSPDWRRWTPAEGQAFFEQLGLTGEFWKLGG